MAQPMTITVEVEVLEADVDDEVLNGVERRERLNRRGGKRQWFVCCMLLSAKCGEACCGVR
eukprot:3746849-Amphidinium_carterae.1